MGFPLIVLTAIFFSLVLHSQEDRKRREGWAHLEEKEREHQERIEAARRAREEAAERAKEEAAQRDYEARMARRSLVEENEDVSPDRKRSSVEPESEEATQQQKQKDAQVRVFYLYDNDYFLFSFFQSKLVFFSPSKIMFVCIFV